MVKLKVAAIVPAATILLLHFTNICLYSFGPRIQGA
jgi:hypothetical protein